MSDPSDPGPPLNHGLGTTVTFPYLESLNAAQHSAVIAPPSTPLQILAGPGSGKTRVLTSRVAYLVQRHGYKPYEIVAVTFTNKSANEMRKRLRVLLGEKQADNLVLGTFHSMCARYLRRYGRHISLPSTFTITDSDDAKKTMSRLIKAKSDVLQGLGMSLKEGAVLSEISKAKAKGEGPAGMAVRARSDPSSSTSTLTFIADLYAEYEESLRAANALDFDDLLVFGLRLFTQVPEVLSSCKHILVDEFQDTNTTQYELMKCFAKVNNGVSVVGDPDQSIYGWRSAEVENLDKMTRDFPGAQAIYLEQNYRSTGAILAAAHSVVSQDSSRIKKKLFTSHPRSTPVNLKVFANPTIEASFIATEIKRMIAYSGGVLNYGDFAILLRYNALSRVIESALQKDSIPNRIIGGHKFFERMEIKDLLAYLQLAENPGFTPAFMRVVNVPKRSIGDKSIADLSLAAKAANISPMELCERIVDGDQLPAGVKTTIKKNLANFVGIVRKLRRAADRGASVADLLRSTIEKTGYEHYLRTSYTPDFESKWENVQELISYCVVVAEEQARETDNNDFLPDMGFLPASSAAAEATVALAARQEAEEAERRLHPMFRSRSASESRSRSASAAVEEQPRKKRRVNGGMKKVEEDVIEVLSDSDEEAVLSNAKYSEDDKAKMKPLSYFLQTSMLSTDTEASNEDDRNSNLKVTLTTVHSAKGLEWPVVFIPAVEQGTYPSYRCTEATEIAEERRLLYVAMTRAQSFLTMSHCQFRMAGGEENDKTLSEFVGLSLKDDPGLFTLGLPDIDVSVRKTLSSMLERPRPDEKAADEMIRKHIRAAPPLSTWDPPEPRDSGHNRFARRDVTKAARAAEYWASEQDDYALPDMSTGFTSARSVSNSHGPRPSHAGSTSSRLPKPYQMGFGTPRSPPKPVVKLPQREHDLPAPLPFSFNNPDAGKKKEEASLGLFEKGNMDFLSDLKSLGTSDTTPGAPARGGASNGLGLPRLNSGIGASVPSRLANGASVGGGQKKPTKRLGMGRLPQWQPKR